MLYDLTPHNDVLGKKKKEENVDCEVYMKPNAKKFTPQDTGKLPRSNYDDLLEV